jgi:hypothetical protein
VLYACPYRVGRGSIGIQIRQVELSFEAVLDDHQQVSTDGAETDLMCCAEEKGILSSIEHSRQDKINPGCCRSLLFVISRGSFVFWIVMICISGCDHLYLSERLGVIVLSSSVD